ncbi:type IX secretion system membrane protein PorP/SprF [Lutimonas saemankumensis]|uniref:PorP/SprF family type IX secretion system membrane protein n=1 Tax=Lutimonas saemankumensis TaxID=483016 RepID=UPI001CD1D747|nr:type IX secretion system membrane protein PorP/SprF [Lutimonas saemankumensis]MCA0931888.1 type IX secretion system membrane protein PorP/SprF [Lutimonas saemankumensis]
MKNLLALILIFSALNLSAQETFPIYSDYLSDNVYLVHPAAAGIGNCGKIRFTYRQQWMGVEDAPSLQTLSFHTRVTEKMALGGIVFNDENGYHSQQGFLATYAYHINFGHEAALNQLSFGLSFMFSQNSVNQNDFVIPDPIVAPGVESTGYYNVDFGLGYHFLDAFGYFTIKNLLLTPRDLANNRFESDNLRRYLLTLGYYLGRGMKFQLEPSIMFQFIEYTGETFADLNLKVYRNIGDKSQLWAALSYRQNFDSNIESFKMITPIIGINYKRFMFSYTYSSQIGDIVLENSGHHQLTLGFNVFCKKPRATGCPNLNSVY